MESVIVKGAKNNLDVSYLGLRKHFVDGVPTDRAGEGEGIVVTHGYSTVLVEQLGEQYIQTNFYKPDVLKPDFIEIKRYNYSSDNWGFVNGYCVMAAVDKGASVCRLDPEDEDCVDLDVCKLDFSEKLGLTYFYSVIDPLSYTYLFTKGHPDVPFGLLEEIFRSSANDIGKINLSQTKRQVIIGVKKSFSDVAKHLSIYYK
jgi:hypothetical protein